MTEQEKDEKKILKLGILDQRRNRGLNNENS